MSRPALPPGLSMLWEQVDAREALRERFGFDGVDDVSAWVVEVLRQEWSIEAGGVSRVVVSAANAVAWVAGEGGGLVVKWSCDPSQFPRLDDQAQVVRVLSERGVPVAAPVGGRRVVAGPAGPLSVVVLPEVDGDWLDVADERAVLAAGASLAHLHAALRERACDPLGPMSAGDVEAWLDDRDSRAVPQASARLRGLLSGLPDLDDRPQLVHHDYRAANVLTRDSMVVAVLDFDDLAPGYRVADLAHASVHLATLFRDWGPTSPDVQRTLRLGYESVRPLGPLEARWYDVLLLWRGMAAVPGKADPGAWAAALA